MERRSVLRSLLMAPLALLGIKPQVEGAKPRGTKGTPASDVKPSWARYVQEGTSSSGTRTTSLHDENRNVIGVFYEFEKPLGLLVPMPDLKRSLGPAMTEEQSRQAWFDYCVKTAEDRREFEKEWAERRGIDVMNPTPTKGGPRFKATGFVDE